MFVKICGITNEEDALLAVALGADALGFNFVPGSTRQITPNAVRDILKRLPPGTTTVGVFRDERPERVVEIVNGTGLGGAQLHGREPKTEVRFVRERVPFVIQGFSAGDPAIEQAAETGADVVLLDSAQPGSGRVFDWELAEGLPPGARLLLAGGLTPDNVADAIERVRPWGVDVASGVEVDAADGQPVNGRPVNGRPVNGRKDARRLARFFEQARRAGADVETDGWVPGDAPLYDWQADITR